MFNPFDPRSDGNFRLAAIKGLVSGVPAALLILLGWYYTAISVHDAVIIAVVTYFAFFAREEGR